jgi:hypothetical protein
LYAHVENYKYFLDGLLHPFYRAGEISVNLLYTCLHCDIKVLTRPNEAIILPFKFAVKRVDEAPRSARTAHRSAGSRTRFHDSITFPPFRTPLRLGPPYPIMLLAGSSVHLGLWE